MSPPRLLPRNCESELRVRGGWSCTLATHSRATRGNYFGAAVIRSGRLPGVADGGQVLLSGATAELVADHVPDGADLVNLGAHRLRDLGR
jgi:class 3 adenylate cyclase